MVSGEFRILLKKIMKCESDAGRATTARAFKPDGLAGAKHSRTRRIGGMKLKTRIQESGVRSQKSEGQSPRSKVRGQKFLPQRILAGGVLAWGQIKLN